MILLPEETVFFIEETYFSTNALIQVVEMNFLASKNHFVYIFSETSAEKALFLSVGNLFLNESFILAIGEGFFFQ